MRREMHQDTILPSDEIANEVYNALMIIGGALPSERDAFLIYARGRMDGVSEWRFQGHFGFGGKFYTKWRFQTKVWYVDYYKEDNTMERAGLRDKLNERLEEIRKKYASNLK